MSKSQAPKVGATIGQLKTEVVTAFQTQDVELLNDIRARFTAMKEALTSLQQLHDVTFDIATGPLATKEATKYLNGYTRIRQLRGDNVNTVRINPEDLC